MFLSAVMLTQRCQGALWMISSKSRKSGIEIDEETLGIMSLAFVRLVDQSEGSTRTLDVMQ